MDVLSALIQMNSINAQVSSARVKFVERLQKVVETSFPLLFGFAALLQTQGDSSSPVAHEVNIFKPSKVSLSPNQER